MSPQKNNEQARDELENAKDRSTNNNGSNIIRLILALIAFAICLIMFFKALGNL